MTDRPPTPHPLRRLRRLLALLGLAAVALVVLAGRLHAGARAVAAIAAAACVVAWLVLLEAEGRAADRLERHGRRRSPARRPARARLHRPDHRQATLKKQTARSEDRAV